MCSLRVNKYLIQTGYIVKIVYIEIVPSEYVDNLFEFNFSV